MDVGLQTNGRSPTRVRISTENSGERRRIEGGIEKNRPPWEDLPTILDEVLSSFGADLGGDPALHLSADLPRGCAGTTPNTSPNPKKKTWEELSCARQETDLLGLS